MKQLNNILCDFINTFQLEHPTKGICFEAIVHLFTESLNIKVNSEIHIITINGKGLDVLYILNPELGEDFQTMFVIEDYEVSFNHKHGLKLKGSSAEWGSFILVIQPIGKNCTEPTYQELNAKAFN
ncbi:MAG: hypothetical protein IPP02_02950 [Chitinophagaceae bacterium]|jgi:hypothetical protein|nr:hypothetical protein [Chitinophagaceae bacterium]MBK7678958.1 hypothetical protein [Chitinophagaceae bacterium]MBK8299698.1 hypothetical protein [Chitinophagaceae bacterium]MBK9463747.1 hypothetical protein [Chitinophagaceae bacterium]MBK9659136.1 hypothetical protein [Chitinophagaceae bacterium]